MSERAAQLAAHAAALRDAFDRTFAEAPTQANPETEDFLALRIGGDRYVLRLAETAGLFHDKRWRALPGATPALLGIAGFRGTLAPVYDLSVLLGYGPTSSPGWLVLVKTQPPVALAFERLDGHMRVARETISPAAHAPGDQAPVRETLREAEAMRGVLHLPAILETIKDRAHRASPTKRG